MQSPAANLSSSARSEYEPVLSAFVNVPYFTCPAALRLKPSLALSVSKQQALPIRNKYAVDDQCTHRAVSLIAQTSLTELVSTACRVRH